MKSDVIILAGGLGTRLKHLIPELPKPMAPVNKEPFLKYIFQYLEQFNTQHVILSVGHQHEKITDYFGKVHKGIEISYSIEKEPLGTGGAIAMALSYAKTDNVFILNGDTYFGVNLPEMEKQFNNSNYSFCMALKEMLNFDRYGSVQLKENLVVSFEEKTYKDQGLINAGTYLLNKSYFLKQNWPNKFSFEKEFLEKYVSRISFGSFISDAYFIDIGIPSDYYKAQQDFKSM